MLVDDSDPPSQSPMCCPQLSSKYPGQEKAFFGHIQFATAMSNNWPFLAFVCALWGKLNIVANCCCFSKDGQLLLRVYAEFVRVILFGFREWLVNTIFGVDGIFLALFLPGFPARQTTWAGLWFQARSAIWGT